MDYQDILKAADTRATFAEPSRDEERHGTRVYHYRRGYAAVRRRGERDVGPVLRHAAYARPGQQLRVDRDARGLRRRISAGEGTPGSNLEDHSRPLRYHVPVRPRLHD